MKKDKKPQNGRKNKRKSVQNNVKKPVWPLKKKLAIHQNIVKSEWTEDVLHESELKYHMLFKSMSQGFYLAQILYDENGTPYDYRYLEVNSVFEKMLGLTREQIIGKTYNDLVPPDPKSGWTECFKRVMQTGIPENYTFSSEIYHSYYEVYAFKPEEGKFCALVKDITEFMEAKEVLRQSEEKFRSVFENSVVGNSLTHLDGSLNVNNALCKMLGYSKQEMSALKWQQITHPDDIKKTQDEIDSLCSGATKEARFEKRFIHQNGNVVWVDLSSSLRRDNKGNPLFLISTVIDISERKRADEALRASGERLRLALEAANSGVWEWDLRTNENIWSDELWKLYGLEPQSCLPTYEIWMQTIHPDDREMAEKKVQEAGRTGSELNAEWRVVDRNGTVRWLLSRGRPLKDANGNAVRFIGIVLDITKRKQAEEQIELLKHAIDVHYDGAYWYDSNNKLIYVNDAGCQAIGYRREELLGSSVTFVNQRATESRMQEVWTQLRTHGNFSGESLHRRKDGSEFPVEISSTYVQFGGREYNCGFARDITDRKQTEETVRQLQKLEGLGTLAGGIAHDFNNILGIILAYNTSIIKFKDDSKKLDLATETITKAVDRGRTLVRQILTFARKTEITFEAVDANDIVMEMMAMLYETFPKILTYSQNFDKSIPYINADRTQLHQVLLNLCVNARDAMPKGGVLTINTRVASAADMRHQHPDAAIKRYVCIEVSDTGEGMTEEIKKRIFEPFFTTKGIGRGTGMGLAVVFGVIQSHKGFIDVETEPGKGTTFRIYLPTSQTAKTIIEKEKKETLEEIPGGTETVMVVEDEEMLMMSLRMVLMEKGYTVHSAADGFAAVKMYQEEKNNISLVITDFGLPNISGLEVCRKIKQINPDAGIILATGFLDPDMKAEFLQSGIQHFLFKPYDLRQVVKLIREVLDKKQNNHHNN